MPPSPAPPRFFEGKKLKQPRDPKLPVAFPRQRDPIDWAASSITGNRRAWAISKIASIFAGSPNRWTGMIARVRLVIAFSIRPGSRLKSSGLMSTRTGRAPSRAIDPTVATKVKGGVITSSPGPISNAIKARRRASEPEAQPMAWRQPTKPAASASSASTSGPRTNC